MISTVIICYPCASNLTTQVKGLWRKVREGRTDSLCQERMKIFTPSYQLLLNRVSTMLSRRYDTNLITKLLYSALTRSLQVILHCWNYFIIVLIPENLIAGCLTHWLIIVLVPKTTISCGFWQKKKAVGNKGLIELRFIWNRVFYFVLFER